MAARATPAPSTEFTSRDAKRMARPARTSRHALRTNAALSPQQNSERDVLIVHIERRRAEDERGSVQRACRFSAYARRRLDMPPPHGEVMLPMSRAMRERRQEEMRRTSFARARHATRV